MSGIYGYIANKNLNKSCTPSLERLSLWNKAYGKDGHFEKKEPAFLLGCHMEKLHSLAARPNDLIIRGNCIWTIDAVLYNREEIYALLNTQNTKKLQDLSDEELLVDLIEGKGYESLSQVNGDFAGVAYDTEANSITLFRDHMGVRPLYYYVSDSFICFSTDLRGVLSVENVDVTINKEWVYRTYFNLLNITSTSTEYEYIYCVRPASALTIDFTAKECKNKYPSRLLHQKEYDYEVDNRQRNYWKTLSHAHITEKKYWYLGSHKIRYKTEEEYCNKMRELVEDSVQRRLNAFDGIAGSEFSGGLDSSLISILIKKFGRDCVYCSWSKDPKDLPLTDRDERRIIQEICDKYSIHCDYLSKVVPFPDFTEFNNRSSAVLDISSKEAPLEKYAFWPSLNTIALINSASYVSKHGGKVVFTGHGGDEGISHRANPYELIYHGELKNYINYYIDIFECKNFRLLRGIKRAGKAYLHSVISRIRKPFVIKSQRKYTDQSWQIANPNFIKWGKSVKVIPFSFGYDITKYVTRYGDRNRMDCVAVYGAYCGVRYMLPYLDYRVIDYAVSIERGMYLKHGTDRYILKKAFSDVLPKSLTGKVDKSDPSYRSEIVEPVSPETRAEAIRKRILEYKSEYNIPEVDGIFSLDDILSEINSKDISGENIGELTKKCETVIDTLRLLLVIKKARK